MAIVELGAYTSRSTSMLDMWTPKRIPSKPLPIKDELWYKILGATIIDSYRPSVNEPQQWTDFVTKLVEYSDSKKEGK